MNENDILGFDPRQLSILAQTDSKSSSNDNVYHTRPEESTSKDGVYRSTIKIVYNPFNFTQSIIEQQGYYIEDEQGGLYVVSSLTNNDTNCPIFKAWKQCHFAEPGSVLWKQAAKKEDGGQQLFEKRFARYTTIQVLQDKNHPELEGKYMLWKMPKSIYDMVMNKQNPSVESGKCPIPVMDFLFGRSIELEVKPGEGAKGSIEYRRQTKYLGEISEDVVSCTNPDKSPLLNAEQTMVLDKYVAQMKEIWKEKDPEERAKKQEAVNADPNTAKLRAIYNTVLENIKQFCPNVYDEMSYKPWNEQTTTRVNKWISTVLAGNVPAKKDSAQPTPVSSVLDNVGSNNPFASDFAPASTPTQSFDAPVASSEDDDLPF